MLGIRHCGATAIDLYQGDITDFVCDVMVTAANAALAGGGGVDGAIHQAGGPTIAAECQRLGGTPTGTAVMTTAGNLPAKKLIHAVGPVWQGGTHNEASLLRGSYTSSLTLAHGSGARHIAFPAISTGAYGYPHKAAALETMTALREFLSQHPDTLIRRITIVFMDGGLYRIFQDELFAAFPETEKDDL